MPDDKHYAVPRLVQGILLAEDTFSGETVYLAQCRQTGLVYRLPSAGFEALRIMDGIASLEQIAEHIASEFDVSRDRALADLGVLVEELEQLGLIASAT